MQDIAIHAKVSLHKVAYWMARHRIPSRSISDAVYLRYHPHGDPFKFRPPKTPKDARLFGMGLGLYWGEGTKANRGSVRLGNTDPELLRTFMTFLVRFFRVKKSDFRFGVQVFTDMNIDEVMRYWVKKLRVRKSQFYKPTITKSGSLGTYRQKSQYGVVTVFYHNTRLRNLLVSLLPM